MKLTDKRMVLKRIDAVRKLVEAEISSNRGNSPFANALSTEGFAGGYLQALNDVEGALRHGYPSDHRRYWSAADRKLSKDKP
jgi:hypothetical protein